MKHTLKNIFVLGAVLLIMVVAWVGAEIVKSNNLIELAQDPQASIQRGVDDAKREFNDGHVYFKSIVIDDGNLEYPGVLKSELKENNKDYGFSSGNWCGTDFHLKSIALELGSYEYNEYYVLAYNLELVKLLKGS